MMVRATHPCTSYQTRILLPPIASDIVLDLAVDWCRKWRLSLLSMTGSDSSGDYDNPDLLELIARLNIRDDEHPHPRPRTPPRPRIPPRLRTPPRPRTPPSTAAAQPPPYTPQNRPHTVSRPRTVPHVHAVPRIHAGTGETIYSIDSPRLTSTSGPVYTREWSIAGNATQAVPGGRVHVVARGTPSKKSRGPKKVAFVVFCGINYGVFLSWRETEPLVSGVRNCIFRGYVTLREAQAAFAYAHERGWTRIADPSRTSAIRPCLSQFHSRMLPTIHSMETKPPTVSGMSCIPALPPGFTARIWSVN
ncbi:hypothetical protein C8R43DRAFT_965124 [Mycena crocata]|nr:hypothetical protein C8R43DRAFT_965124 [Mycena crocata]